MVKHKLDEVRFVQLAPGLPSRWTTGDSAIPWRAIRVGRGTWFRELEHGV